MKIIIIIFSMCLFIESCGNKIDINGSSSNNNSASAPVDSNKSITSLTGQIYYSANEILYSIEKEAYAGYSYSLMNFHVYIMSNKHAYRVFPDFDGNWYLDNMEAGTYQVIIKSKEYFQDDQGTFTYMLVQNVDVKENTITAMGILHPIRMYLDNEETQNAIQDVGDKVPSVASEKPRTTADLN